jgi:hypothetical protein
MSLRWMSQSKTSWHGMSTFEIRSDVSVLKVPCSSPCAEKLVGLFMLACCCIAARFQNCHLDAYGMLMLIPPHVSGLFD